MTPGAEGAIGRRAGEKVSCKQAEPRVCQSNAAGAPMKRPDDLPLGFFIFPRQEISRLLKHFEVDFYNYLQPKVS